jgi:FAD/FMN-containing dehydrogenase
MTATSLDLAGRDGQSINLTPLQIDELRSRMEGLVVEPGQAGWDDAVQIWNGMAASAPALVLQPASTKDVAAAVGFARDQGVLLSIKGGGHNIAGTSLVHRGLTLEMSRMREVTVDAEAGLVHVGPGCLLKDVDHETQSFGLATVLGFVSETGVAGLTLGGGFGYLTRRFGWTVDNLEEVEVVTADGAIRVANRNDDADLYWAIRGGGGNFGVVTRFTFRLHPVGPTVTGGLIAWSADLADEVLTVYRDLTESAPRELTAAATIRLAPPAPFVPPEWHGKPIAGLIVCHSGPDPDDDLVPLRVLGTPIVDVVTERPYVAQQSMLDALEPRGLHRYWKTEFLPGLAPEFLDAFRTSALEVKSPLSQSIIFHLGGALNDRAKDDGAVGNRDARYVAGLSGTWPPGMDPAPHVAWVRAGWEAIRPYSTGGNYVNFQQAEDDATRTAEAYGGNLDRLRRVKSVFDPGNLFRVNRNISPADR